VQEPWTYVYQKRSPTKNKEVAIALGLKPTSLHTLVPA
jgi:hypothetical protein